MAGRFALRTVLRELDSLVDMEAAKDLLDSLRLSRRLVPTLGTGPAASRIIVVSPHPDDEIIGPGGTLLAARDRGAKIHVVHLTCGGATEKVRACRRAEASKVSYVLGAELSFLGQAEGQLSAAPSAVSALAEIIRRWRAEAVFIPFLLDDHPDHRDASRLLRAVLHDNSDIGDPEIWAYQVYTPLPGNVVVDITLHSTEKANTIAAYESQMEIRNWAHWALGLNAFNSRVLPRSPVPRYAETFFVVSAKEYVQLCDLFFSDKIAQDRPPLDRDQNVSS